MTDDVDVNGDDDDEYDDGDDIYIMMKCLYVSMSVTFLLILPSPFSKLAIYI